MSADRSPRPSRRLREWAFWTTSLVVGGVAAVAPAVAEAEANRALRERIGVGEDFRVHVDLDGLDLRGLDRPLPGGRGHVHVDHLRLRPGTDGLHLELDGLRVAVTRGAERPPSPADAPRSDSDPIAEASSSSSSSSAPAPKDPLEALLELPTDLARKLRGVPVHVDARDSEVRIELAPGLSATAHDPEFELPGDGTLTGRGRFALATPSGTELAQATLELGARDSLPGALAIHGRVDFEGGTLDLVGGLDAHGAELEVHERSAKARSKADTLGSASVHASRSADGMDLAVDARDLPLDGLAPLVPLAAELRGGELPLTPLFAGARLDGRVELHHRSGGRTSARLDAVELRDLGVDSDLLAGQPLRFADLSLDGELHREAAGSQAEAARIGGTLLASHGALQVSASGQLDAEGLAFTVEMPTLACQSLIDDLPGGTAPLLEGTRTSGDIAAEFGLDLNFAELEAARQRYLVDSELVLPELEDFEPPGELRFDFPFLESCAIERLAPSVDVEGLAGPYHHTFTVGDADGAGRTVRRTLAVGDEHYASLDSIPTVALAFVILEDARFWKHDGFDREQIERAFWFNVLEGKVRRGASTITQQTARSLWLGIDRSISRKLAEGLLAAELERGVGKQRILEVYLNIIELGPEVHGVVEAADYHFGKHPSQLNLIEALHLASMAPAPVAYSERFADGVVDGEWRAHLHQQIRRLRIRHLISSDTAKRARMSRLALREHPELLGTE